MRIQGIQGLRGVAVLLVILDHFGLGFASGYLGVDVFFVISGFVITKLLVGQLSSGNFSLRQFYQRRFKRLFLPVVFTIVAAIATGLVLLSPGSFGQTTDTGIAALFGLSNGVIHVQTGDYFATSANANALTHTWSLAVEEQFYVIFPLLLIAIVGKSLSKGTKISAKMLSVATATSLVAFLLHPVFYGVIGWGAIFSYYSPLIRAWEFGVGALGFFLITNGAIKLSLRQAVLFSRGALLALTLLANVPTLDVPFQNTIATLIAAGLALVLVVAASALEGQKNLLTHRGLLWTGNRSYSIYLVHWPIFVFIGNMTDWTRNPWVLASGVIVSLLIGTLLFQVAEKGRIQVSFERRPLLIGSISVIFAVSIWQATVWAYPLVNSTTYSSWEKSQISAPQCHGSQKWCLNGGVMEPDTVLSKPIYLVGDSNALMFYWGLQMVATNLERPLVSKIATGCPGHSGDIGNRSTTCKEYQHELRDFLRNAPPGDVVLGFTDNYVLAGRGNYRDASQELIDSMLQLQQDLISFGHKVITVEPIPNLSWSDRPIDVVLISIKDLKLDIVVPRPDKDIFRQTFEKNSARFSQVLETKELLCPRDECFVFRDGNFVWSDNNHITKFASLEFVDPWMELLTKSR